MQDVSVPVWAVAAVAVGLLLVIAAARGGHRAWPTAARSAAGRGARRGGGAAAQVEEIQRLITAPPAVRDEREYVITEMGAGFEARSARELDRR